MKKLFYLIAMALTPSFAIADITTVSVYDDCSKNGYTRVILPIMGTATVSSSACRTSCDYVQLWAGGPKWATFNVGATITDYANLSNGADATSFYSYADQAPYYNTANVGGLYPWNNPNLNGRTTTWTSSVSTGISDVATTLWGSNWKTPTKAQLDTLCDENGTYGKTTWTWCDGSTTQYVAGCTLKGYKVSGVGDYANYSIFLPAAGYFDYYKGTVYNASDHGYYWSSTEGDSGDAYYYLYFGSNYRSVYDSSIREFGLPVRAVLGDNAVVQPATNNEQPVTNVTLTLKAKGCSSPNVITCSAGQQLQISAEATLNGNSFSRWSDGNTDNPRAITISSDMTLTAEFSAVTSSETLVSIYDDCSKIGYATVTSSTLLPISGTASVSSTSGRTTCDFVQLWAGGPKWATFNVGAIITDYANLAVGADATSFNNYTNKALYYNTANVGGLYAWNNPNLNGRTTTWDSSVSTGISDVATTLWGSNWKTPTQAQLDTLQNSTYGKTTWTWCDGSTTQYVAGCTLKGYKVSGVGDYADMCIFLPAAGCFLYGLDIVIDASKYGFYWSSMEDGSDYANFLDFDSSSRRIYHVERESGLSVRAVLGDNAVVQPNNNVQPTNTVTLTLRINNCSASNVITCPAGQQLQISAVETLYGFHFKQWNDGNTSNPRVVTMNGNKTYTAQFAKNVYTITTATNDLIRGTTMGDTTVEYNDTIYISAIANYGYHFTRWSDGNTSNPRPVQVTEDKTYTVQFDKNTYYITKIANSTCGSIAGSSSSSYLDKVTISATANDGYHFTQWSDGNIDNPRSFILTQDTTFEALFAKNVYSITTAVNDPVRGVVKGDTTVEYMDTVSISATPNYGYHFTQWNDGNTNNPRQIQVTGDKTYTVQFDKNQYTVSTAKDANITSVTGGGIYDYLDEVILTVVANVNYQFDHWSDGNTDNPRTLIMTKDTFLTAFSSKIRSGKCGDNLTWNYANGILVVSDTGAMYDYTQSTMPWVLFRDSITSVVINNGCTSIGNFAFYGLSNKNFKTLELPNSIEKIGQYAFANCAYLKNLTLNKALEQISSSAFAGDERLLFITCFAEEPPLLDESAFENYDVYLKVPCEVQDEYKVAKGWKKFNKDNVSCIGADNASLTKDEVSVEPDVNNATFTWPNNTDANSYSLEIKKDGEVFCTLIFNAQGQLTGIAFAPSREGNRQIAAAEQIASGWRFTVTGLDAASKYTYDLDVRDASEQSIKNYQGQFQTDGITGIDQLTDSPADQFTKIIQDGQLIIQRDGKMYNAQGGEL